MQEENDSVVPLLAQESETVYSKTVKRETNVKVAKIVPQEEIKDNSFPNQQTVILIQHSRNVVTTHLLGPTKANIFLVNNFLLCHTHLFPLLPSHF